MKNNLRRQLIMLTKRLIYAFLVQLFLCTVILASPGNAQRKTIEEVSISLNLQEKTLLQFFRQVESKTDFKFTYNNDLVDLKQNISVVEDNRTLYKVLESVSRQTQLNFVQVNENIHVKSVDSNKEQAVEIAQVVDVTVSGTVTGVNGEPIPGVTVSVPGTTTGTATDLDGKYSLTVPEGSTLVFSFIGFETQNVAIGDRSVIDVTLSEDMTSLDEVVVVGYGTVERKDLTGAIASVNNDEIKELAVTRVDQALTGKIAGVQVLTTTGEPGDAPLVRIRGVGSISAGTNPLYVVDGYPTENIQMLNPNDIESIDVLKDASATAIYGSRGANGVIIITTKRGEEGERVITLDTYYGLQNVLRTPEFLTMEEQAMYYYEGIKNQNLDAGRSVSGDPQNWDYQVPETVMDVIEGRNTVNSDAYDAIFQVAPKQSYNLSARGGSEAVKYAISGEYLNQEGIIINSNFNRYSLRANLDGQLSKNLSIRFNLTTSYSTKRDVANRGGSGGSEGIVGAATTWEKWYPLYNDDGTYFNGYGQDATNNVWNPVAQAIEINRRTEHYRTLGNLNTKYNISDALQLNVMIGANTSNQHYLSFIPELDVFANVADGSDERSNSLNWITETTLNYQKDFNNHNIDGLIGYTTQKQINNSNFVRSRDFPNNLVHTLNAVSNIIYQGNSEESEWSLISYLARVNYNYDYKYYLTASLRTDGSSRFGRDKKYGYFPSAALAWRISGEEFLNEISFINDIKIRASYGETGNNNIGNYAHIATINYETYTFGGSAFGGYAPSRFANPLLTWEKQKSFNLGIDATLFKSRVNFTANYFKTNNHDLLLNVNVPHVTGFDTSLQNIGEVENNGWEFKLETRNFIGNFQWTTGFNISAFKNKVIKLGPEGAPIISGYNITEIGQPMGMFYGYIVDGIFATQSELDMGPIYGPGTPNESRVGDIKFKDVSGPNGVPDGIITSDDRTIMGNPYPDFYFGLTNSFTYKNFSLSVTVLGSQGNEVFYNGDSQLYTRARYKQFSVVKNYWKSEEEQGDGQSPRPNNLPKGGAREKSTRYLDDASYFKINNVNLSYLFSNRIASKLHLSSLRVYISSSDPLIVTKYKFFNPEVSDSSNPLTPGRSYYNYPIATSSVIGINASF